MKKIKIYSQDIDNKLLRTTVNSVFIWFNLNSCSSSGVENIILRYLPLPIFGLMFGNEIQ